VLWVPCVKETWNKTGLVFCVYDDIMTSKERLTYEKRPS